MDQFEGMLKITEIQIGEGRESKKGDLLTLHYSGTLAQGEKFDSSYDRNRPFQFVLGAGRVIKGWDQGLLGMKVGGKRRLEIQPAWAYGERQIGPIPPNSVLHFEVELIEALSREED